MGKIETTQVMKKATCSYCACWLEVGEIIAWLTHPPQVWITKREIYMPHSVLMKGKNFSKTTFACQQPFFLGLFSLKWEIEFYQITTLDKEVWKIDLMRQRNLLDRLKKWRSDGFFLKLFLCCIMRNYCENSQKIASLTILLNIK